MFYYYIVYKWFVRLIFCFINSHSLKCHTIVYFFSGFAGGPWRKQSFCSCSVARWFATSGPRSFSICFGLHCSVLLQILSIFFLLLLFILGLREPFCLLVLVHDRVASLLVCCFNCFFFLFFNIKYKSFLAGVELNFGIANRITGFRIFFFWSFLKVFKNYENCILVCVSVCFVFFL